jgi:carbonic anhydrase
MAAQPLPTADEAFQRLVLGNRRFSAGQPAHPHQTPQRRQAVAAAPRPFAAVLGCIDSRVPPEIIFDQGLGDLFVVRVAGHVVDRVVLGSLEMAVESTGLRLIVVLGHDLCAAMAAAVDHLGFGVEPAAPSPRTVPPGRPSAAAVPASHLQHVIEALKPAVDHAVGRPGSLLANAIDANVRRVVEQLRATGPTLARHVQETGLRIVGARYDVTTGEVIFMP